MAHKREYRILVVDDDEDVRTLLGRSLGRMGVRCDVACDGLAAQDMLTYNRYDAVITDLRMPRKHGHKLIVDILGNASPPMVIVMTAVLEPKVVVDLIARGVTDVVQKPLAYEVFAAKVCALLDRQAHTEPLPEKDVATSVASQIEQSTSALKAQLASVEESFHGKIETLGKQKEALEEGLLDSVRVLGNLVGSYKASKGSHACRVEKMAEWLARNVGIKMVQIRNLRMAALLHDLGQFGMPDDVRRKPPGALSTEEREVFVKYPAIGATLISEIRGTKEVAELVEAHGENFDGSGFPTGKRGADISLGARIIRVCDGCDTFLMYCGEEEALGKVFEHLNSEKGKAYDPALVTHAIAYLKESSQMTDEGTMTVAAKDLTEGMVLAENVYDEKGLFLASDGALLTDALLRHLERLLEEQQVRVQKPPSPEDPSGEEPSDDRQ